MDELEQLRKEKARLMGIEEGRRKQYKRARKIRVIKREIKEMKRPKIIRGIRGVAIDSTKGVGMLISAGAKKASPVVKRGLQNLAENARREAKTKSKKRTKFQDPFNFY